VKSANASAAAPFLKYVNPAIQIGLRLNPALLGPGEDRCVVGNGLIQITRLLVVKRAVFQRGGAFELVQPRIANDIRASNDRGIGPAGTTLNPIIGVPFRMGKRRDQPKTPDGFLPHGAHTKSWTVNRDPQPTPTTKGMDDPQHYSRAGLAEPIARESAEHGVPVPTRQ